MSPGPLGLWGGWVEPAHLRESSACPSPREWRQRCRSESGLPHWERPSPCHKLGTVRTSASRVIFFGFRKSSFAQRRQKTPHFFPPGNQRGCKAVLVSLRKTYVCVYTPQFSRVTFIKVNWRHQMKAGSERQRIGAKLGLATVLGECQASVWTPAGERPRLGCGVF